MEKPINKAHLANLLFAENFKRITAINDLIGVEDASDFLDALSPEDIQVQSNFPRYIPIVRERVSIKKHDYSLITHVIFWLKDGQPYLYTPEPTIEHTRLGMKNQKLKRSEHLMIPHNCDRFDLLNMRQGHCNQTDKPILELNIISHKV